MTEEMFDRSAFLAQAPRQDMNNSRDINSILLPYTDSQVSGSTSTFQSSHQNSLEQTTNAYVHHLNFPEPQCNNWKIDHADVSALSIEEASIEEKTKNCRRKLIETGQMERLNELVERRLSEAGWRLDMMAYCRSIVKRWGPSITHEELYQELKISARERVPKDIEDEIIKSIKLCYESQFKD